VAEYSVRQRSRALEPPSYTYVYAATRLSIGCSATVALPRRRPDLNFGTCALVGSGASLLGRGYGAAIDAHDVVVHVNNIPASHMHGDMGSRTDVLFSTPCNVGHEDETMEIEHFNDGEWICNTAGGCPFRAAVFRSPVAPNSCSDGERARIERAGSTSSIGLGVGSKAASDQARHFRREGTDYCCEEPSTGLHALVSLALTCRVVRLYGFRGSETFDGHFEGHDIEKEHALERAMIEVRLDRSDFIDQDMWERWRITARVEYGDS